MAKARGPKTSLTKAARTAQNFKISLAVPPTKKGAIMKDEGGHEITITAATKRQSSKLTEKPIKKRIRNRFGNDTQHLGFEKQFVVNAETGRAN